MDLATMASLLTALGAGGAVGQYVGAGRARREVRSSFLDAITAVEDTRFCKAANGEDYPQFVTALRKFETAALIARIPKQGVHHYIVLARAARYYSDGTVDYDPVDNDFFGSIDFRFDAVVRDTARLLTTVAWSPWRTKLTLRVKLRKLRGRVVELLDTGGLSQDVGLAQRYFGVLPGPLGQLPHINKEWAELVEDDDQNELPPRHF